MNNRINRIIQEAFLEACECSQGCEADKRWAITGATLEILCNDCGELLHGVELDDPGAEQRVRY